MYELLVINRSSLIVELTQSYWPHLWTLKEDIEYKWEWDIGEGYLKIPAGYQCDGASIPFRFYDQVDPINALPGAFLHDILYETCVGSRQYRLENGSLQDIALSNAFTSASDKERRSRADALLKYFWLYDKMPNEMADKGFIAVRLFGRSAWVSLEPQPQNVTIDDALTNLAIKKE